MNEIKHWAENLQVADRVTGTIRHKTDGNLNRHDVEMIVVQVIVPSKQILAYIVSDCKTMPISFNELDCPDNHE